MPETEVMAEVQQEEINDEDFSTLSDEKLDEVIASDDNNTDDTGTAALPDEDKTEIKTDEEDNGSDAGTSEGTPAEETTSDSDTSDDDDKSLESSEMKQLKKERDKLKQMYENDQRFISRQADEIGTLRNRQQEMETTPEINQDDFNDKYADDPFGAVKELLNQREQEKISYNNRRFDQHAENKRFILEGNPDFEDFINDIIELGRGDGVSEDYLNNFRNNPYATSTGLSLQYLKRAKLLRDMKKLKEDLDATNEKLKTMPDKIAKAANGRGKTLAGQTSITNKDHVTATTDEQIANLSDDELDAIIKGN